MSQISKNKLLQQRPIPVLLNADSPPILPMSSATLNCDVNSVFKSFSNVLQFWNCCAIVNILLSSAFLFESQSPIRFPFMTAPLPLKFHCHHLMPTEHCDKMQFYIFYFYFGFCPVDWSFALLLKFILNCRLSSPEHCRSSDDVFVLFSVFEEAKSFISLLREYG